MTRARYLADFKQDDGTGYATKYATGFSPQFSGTPTGVVAASLAADIIDGTKLADNAVNTEHIADGSITAVKVAADLATQAEIDAKASLSGADFTGPVTITSHPTHGNNGHSKRFRSVYPGNSTINYNILRYARFWWGDGTVKISVANTYYGPSAGWGEFLINGHTRSGLPSIHTLSNYNVPTPTAASYNAAEWCYINLSAGNYRRYDITVESWHIKHNTNENAVAATNAYHMYASHEVT